MSRARTTQLLIATRNHGKLVEFRQLFATLPGVEVVALDDIAMTVPAVIEDGATFEDNARKKALEVAAATHMLVLSDDSGLEVDALDGRPGVYSARYAGDHARDEDNNQKLLAELRDVPPEQRTARYRVVLALADPHGPLGAAVHLEQGACEGTIRRDPSGRGGFGYDPYFQPRGHTLTMAELPPEEKNRISHRAEAAEKMRQFLERYLPTRAL
jgi:XTP/dITP diphosphohydrolase